MTKALGRNTNDRVWTNWYSAGQRAAGPFGKWAKILKLAHMRESLFENNLIRTYPEGVKTGYADGQTEVPEFARRWRTADGTWNDLRPDADGTIDPMVGAAYTRFFRNLGDDQGLAGVRRRENPATNPVSVREVSRKLLAPQGPRVGVPLPQPVGRRVDPVPEPRLDQPRHQRRRPRGPDPAGRGRPAARVRHRPPRRAGLDARPDDARRRRACPPTFLNEVTHWWDGSQIYGSDWETQHSLRSHEGGRMLLTDEGLLPVDEETGAERTGFMRNWWVGLGMLTHGLRQGAQRDRRHAGREVPRLGRRGALPDRPAGQRRH